MGNLIIGQPAPAMILDRRREIRREATGDVWLAPEGSRPALVKAALVEISGAGFRVRHESELLAAGKMVRFRHAEGAGRARVAWNTQRGRRREAGFLIVAE